MSPFRLSPLLCWAALLLTGCASTPDETMETAAPVTRPKARRIAVSQDDGFMAAQDKNKADDDFPAMLRAGRERQRTHPKDLNAWCTTAYAAYMLGDLETARSNWQRSIPLAPQRKAEFETSIAITQHIRKRWPQLKLQPPVWVYSDAVLEDQVWMKKAIGLLTARNYDEIERTAKRLQASRAVGVDGVWHLEKFASGLWSVDEGGDATANWQKRQAQIAVWRRARPTALLARVAELGSWTNGAWMARGDEFAVVFQK